MKKEEKGRRERRKEIDKSVSERRWKEEREKVGRRRKKGEF